MRRGGFTMIEAVVSTIIVGVMLVAAMRTVGAAQMSQYRNLVSLRGVLLGEDLMNEVLALAYEDPDEPPVFGPEPVELVTGRASWDDVDDYDGLVDTPPSGKDGTPIAGMAGWERRVRVVYVEPGDLGTPQLLETGLKRITVSIHRDGVVVAELTGLRARGW